MDISKIIIPNPDRKPFFIPSLSSGGTAASLLKNREIEPGLTTRFYSKEFPAEFRHPYFLITAGHFYKKMDARQRFGLDKEETFVFGDSGGFQIATGAIKWDVSIRQQIFEFLEENSDVAANLDIPPRIQYDGKFKESLDFSVDNFKYFESKQTGKTKFLNVLQGNNPGQYDVWYNEVKDFEFNGWCIGNSRRLVNCMYAIALLLKNHEFENPRNQFIHMLGISKVSDFFILAIFQKLLNKHSGGKIQLMTDSSSPGQFPVFGDLIVRADYTNQNWTQMHVSRNFHYNDEDLIPAIYHTPITKNWKMKIINDYKQEYYDRGSLQNLIVFNKTFEEIVVMCSSNVELLESIIPSDLYQVLRSLYEMFESDDPIAVYEKYRQIYIKYGGDWVPDRSNTVINSFFES